MVADYQGTAEERGVVDPEAGLAPDIQVSHDLGRRVLHFDRGRRFLFASHTPTPLGPRPIDLEAVAVGVAFVRGEGDTRRQINVDRDGGHDRPWRTGERAMAELAVRSAKDSAQKN